MNKITLGKQEYTLPFADLLPALTSSEYSDLKTDIAARGVIVPIIVDGDMAVIDGQHRLKVAVELGLDTVPLEIHTDLTDEEKRAMAWDLNAHRRHMTPEQRKARAVVMRQQGMSYREIGDKLGVDHKTARNDILSTGEYSPVDLPKVITGKDGKQRKATKPAPIRTDTDEHAAIKRTLEALPVEYRDLALALCPCGIDDARDLARLYSLCVYAN